MKNRVIVLGLIILSLSFLGLQTSDERDKIKAAMDDIRTIATGIADHCTDHLESPPNAGPIDENGAFYKAIVPLYIKEGYLPIKDPWGHNYLVYTREAINGQYGISGMDPIDFLVVSLGRDGVKEDWKYDPANAEAGVNSDLNPDNDLIMLDGAWIRCPIK